MGGIKKQNENIKQDIKVKGAADQQLKKQVDQEAVMDLIRQLVAIVSALLPFLAAVSLLPEWLTEDNLNQFLIIAGLVVGFLFNVYSIYKNHYSGPRARLQKLLLKRKGLK